MNVIQCNRCRAEGRREDFWHIPIISYNHNWYHNPAEETNFENHLCKECAQLLEKDFNLHPKGF